MEEEKPTSVVYDHCVSVYNAMKDLARMEEIPNPSNPDETVEALVYEGQLTRLFQQLQLATPRYTHVMNALKAMGCAEQLRRGGGGSPSRWLLKTAPTEEAFRSFEERRSARSGKVARLEQQLRDLNRRVLLLEEQLRVLEGGA